MTLDQPLANAFALRQTLYHQSHNLSHEQVLELPVFTPLCKVLLVSPCKVSQAVQSLDQREAGLDVIHPQALFESWLDLGPSGAPPCASEIGRDHLLKPTQGSKVVLLFYFIVISYFIVDEAVTSAMTSRPGLQRLKCKSTFQHILTPTCYTHRAVAAPAATEPAPHTLPTALTFPETCLDRIVLSQSMLCHSHHRKPVATATLRQATHPLQRNCPLYCLKCTTRLLTLLLQIKYTCEYHTPPLSRRPGQSGSSGATTAHTSIKAPMLFPDRAVSQVQHSTHQTVTQLLFACLLCRRTAAPATAEPATCSPQGTAAVQSPWAAPTSPPTLSHLPVPLSPCLVAPSPPPPPRSPNNCFPQRGVDRIPTSPGRHFTCSTLQSFDAHAQQTARAVTPVLARVCISRPEKWQ